LLEAAPSTRREFVPTDIVDVAAEVYAAAPVAATVVTSIRGDAGERVFEATENVPADTFRDARGAYQHHIRIRLEDLDGRYVLRVEARPESGASVVHEIPFSVTR